MKLDHLPAPEDLMDEPQLSAVVALETTLLCTLRSLLAAHPELFAEKFPRTIEEKDHWAERVIYLGVQLSHTLEKYSSALLGADMPPDDDNSGPDDIPF